MAGWFIIWAGGEAELEVAGFDTSVVDCIHFDLANTEELSARLDDLTRRPTEPT